MKIGQRKLTLILLLLVFVLSIFVRLSSILDFVVKGLGIDLFMRLSTRLPWLLAIAGLLVVVGVVLVRRDFSNVKQRVTSFWRVNKAVILLSAGIVLSAVLSLVFAAEKEQPFYGVFYYILMVLEFLLVMVLWGSDIVRVWKRLNYSLVVILLVIAVVQITAFANGGADNQIIRFFDSYSGFMPVSYFTLVNGNSSILRPSSLMADPNFMGIFVSIVLLVSGDEIFVWLKKRKINWFAVIGFVSSVALILLTNSRTAFVMVVAGVLAYIFGFFVGRVKPVKKTDSANSKKVLSVVWIDSLYNRVKDALTFADGSSQEHLRFGRAAIEIFEKYPVLGVGIGNYPLYYQTMIDSTLIFATPHSAYLKVLAELGLVGTVALGLFILYFVQLVVRSRKAVLMAIFVAMLAGNLFYDFFMTPWVWFYLGVIYCTAKNGD